MGTYLLRRLVGTIPVMVLISLLVFLLIQAAPGDPTLMLLGEDSTAEDIAEARERWGLDSPSMSSTSSFSCPRPRGTSDGPSSTTSRCWT